MAVDQRLRAVLVLIVTFGLGVAAGAALQYRFTPLGLPGESRLSQAADSVDLDRIPIPLEALGLTGDETSRLKVIARRWRRQGSSAMVDFRQRVSTLEDGMFAEMLCALPEDKRDRYVADLRAEGYDEAIIQRRMALVRGDNCPATEPK